MKKEAMMLSALGFFQRLDILPFFQGLTLLNCVEASALYIR